MKLHGDTQSFWLPPCIFGFKILEFTRLPIQEREIIHIIWIITIHPESVGVDHPY